MTHHQSPDTQEKDLVNLQKPHLSQGQTFLVGSPVLLSRVHRHHPIPPGHGWEAKGSSNGVVTELKKRYGQESYHNA
jgi:hypothetical protein